MINTKTMDTDFNGYALTVLRLVTAFLYIQPCYSKILAVAVIHD